MFASAIQTTLAGRSRALLATARSLLIVEDDRDVDWEVDQEPAGHGTHPHRERLGAAWGGPHRRRRPGQPPAREQVCLSPLPSRDPHRRATPTMHRVASPDSATARRSTASCASANRLA
jgi:hypothetical protein